MQPVSRSVGAWYQIDATRASKTGMRSRPNDEIKSRILRRAQNKRVRVLRETRLFGPRIWRASDLLDQAYFCRVKVTVLTAI